MKGVLIMISLTFESFYEYVSARISSVLGIGLESLADVDLWAYYSSEPETKEYWLSAIRDAAEYALSEQDDMPDGVLEMF
jgi:hypothetical protein